MHDGFHLTLAIVQLLMLCVNTWTICYSIRRDHIEERTHHRTRLTVVLFAACLALYCGGFLIYDVIQAFS